LRCLLLLALWSVALPAVRRDLALRASVSLRRIQPGRGRDWLVACRRQPGTARATPSPHCATFGALVLLRFDTQAGPRRACVLDRALALRLRIAGHAPRRPAGVRAPNC
jgi:hypothetical protein